MQCILIKAMNSRIRAPFHIFFLNPDYVAARSLRSLRSNYNYYMDSSLSGHDGKNPALWLATQVGKIMLSCCLGITRFVQWEIVFYFPYDKSFSDQAWSDKTAGCWPWCFFCVFMGLDSISVHNSQKNHLANIQPSWPHTWSITYIY